MCACGGGGVSGWVGVGGEGGVNDFHALGGTPAGPVQVRDSVSVLLHQAQSNTPTRPPRPHTHHHHTAATTITTCRPSRGGGGGWPTSGRATSTSAPRRSGRPSTPSARRVDLTLSLELACENWGSAGAHADIGARLVVMSARQACQCPAWRVGVPQGRQHEQRSRLCCVIDAPGRAVVEISRHGHARMRALAGLCC